MPICSGIRKVRSLTVVSTPRAWGLKFVLAYTHEIHQLYPTGVGSERQSAPLVCKSSALYPTGVGSERFKPYVDVLTLELYPTGVGSERVAL